LPASRTIAKALADGDAALVECLASGLLKPLRNNFVERPWGGMRIRAYKGLCPLPDQKDIGGAGLGEAFEIAAFDDDGEARAHPSRLRFDDGSEATLPGLLRRHGAALLGDAFVARYGATFPLLPKTLDVKELLSVQGHPEGNTEVYVVIDADPGATIRLGFGADQDPRALSEALVAGRTAQQRLQQRLAPQADVGTLQALLQPWLAARAEAPSALPPGLDALFASGARGEIAALLEQLKGVYWRMLDAMNAVPVAPGQILYNATPDRVAAATGRLPSAEVHALGNPEQREVLMLEIRRPGPTFRAWDNVRFPLRDVDVEAAIGALNLGRTQPGEFEVEREELPGRAGVSRSVVAAGFTLEHLRPAPAAAAHVPAEPPHSLHVIRGSVALHADTGRELGYMQQGESAIVPARVGAYHVATGDPDGVEVVKVSLPS
jgi:mannose-6-phosphate isomerase class I